TAVVAVIAALSYVLTGVAVPRAAAEDKAQAAAVEFTADGQLKQPVGYRKWVYVGEVITPNDLNGGEATFPEFHAVYMDSKRFKNEPGYWAYFSFGHKYPLKAEVHQNAAAACNQCHQDNAKTDWVF